MSQVVSQKLDLYKQTVGWAGQSIAQAAGGGAPSSSACCTDTPLTGTSPDPRPSSHVEAVCVAMGKRPARGELLPEGSSL